jgi:hypothetical protein
MTAAARTALTLAAGIVTLSVAACGSGGTPSQTATQASLGFTSPASQDSPSQTATTASQDHTSPASQSTPSQSTPSQSTPAQTATPASQGSTSPAAQPSAPAAQFKVPGQLTATAVTSFQLTQGQPGWAAGEQREVAGSAWTFGPSGSFSWTTTDTADMAKDLLPVTGSYTASADGISFHGTHTVTSSVGSRTVIVDGTVRQGGSGYQVAMRMTSSSGMGAVVDGQQFAQASSAVNESVSTARAS